MVALATAFVKIRPDTSGFRRDVETQIGRHLTQAARRWGEDAGRSFSRSFNDRVRSDTDRTPLGPSRQRTRRQGEESGGSFADGFRRRIEDAVRSLPPVRIGAARSEAEEQLRRLQIGLRELSGKRIGVDLDAAAAVEQAQRLERQLNDLAANSPDIQVRVDAAAAAARIAEMVREVDRLDRMNPDVRVDVDRSAAARIGQIGSSVSMLMAAGISLGPAIIPVAAAAAAAIAGIGVAATSAFAGIGVGILAFQGVGEAVSALGAAQDEAAKSSASLSGAQNAVASASDGVRSAQSALANTTAQVAESARQAARQVTDAQLSLTRAERDARDVRLELNDAQREARQRMDDLNQSVKANALSQRQSNLDVADAKKRLDEVIANPKATEAQREQARITYEREVLQMQDLQTRGKRLTETQVQNTKAGISGSAEVLAVRERIAAADDRVAQAQRGLSDARRAQQQQERQGLFQLAQASQAVVSAQRALGQASVAAGIAGGGAMAKLKDAMDALSPAGQRFSKFLFGLKDEMRTLRDAAAEGALPGFQKAIQNVLPYLPRVEDFVGRIATKLGDLAIQASEAFKDPVFQDFFNILDKNAVPALQGMFDAALNIGKGFAGILNAFSPLSEDMGAGLVGLTKRFADFGAGLKDNKGFQEFLGYVREFGPIALKLFGDLFTIAWKLVVALAPLGGVILAGLGLLAGFLAKLDPGVLLYIVGAVAAIAAGLIIMAAGPAAAITAIVVAVTALVGAVLYAYKNVSWFRTAVNAAFGAIAAAALWLWNVVLKPTFSALASFWTNVLAPAAVWLWQSVLKPAFEGISAAVLWAWNSVIKPAFNGIAWVITNVLAPIFTWLYENVIKPVWAGIQLAISVAWAVIQVVFGLIQIAIKAVIAPLFMWLYNSVIKPVWTGIQIAISVAWAIIKVIFGLIQIFIKAVLAPVFTWLWNNVIKPVWNGIKATISAVWENGIKPIFNALGGFIKDHVVPAFKRGVEAIGKAWEAVKDVAKIPVKFIVETVLNNGILAGYNKVAKAFGVKPDDVKIPLPKGFAGGGVLPGYTPGKDVHEFMSPTGGRIDLSGGEAIIRPEGTRALGSGWVDGINSAARSGGVGGVKRFLGSYASGGILGDIGGALTSARKKAGGIIGGVKDFISDPAGTLRKLATALVATVPGKDTTFGKAVTAVPGKVVGFAMDKVKNLFGGGGPTGAGPGFPPWPSSPGAQRGDSGVWRSILGLTRGAGLPYAFGNAYRPGDPLWHGSGRAVDFMGYNQDRLASFFMNMRPRVLELIHTTNQGGYYITRGQRQASMGEQNELHRNHLHVAMAGGGIMPPVKTYDRGGAWPSGTIGVNTSGRTEHVATGGTMDALVDLLEDLIVAVRQVAPGVGRELNGGLSQARQLARARR